jgi:RNA polymerase sigma-70 factor, ECF subfamily
MNLLEINRHEFGALVEPLRRELHVHCYRMLGSVHDAEDMVQETFLRAWRRRGTYEGRASLRAWLYKIATNACLDALDKRPRRFVPRTREAVTTLEQPIPADVNEPIWLEPYPDELLMVDDQTPERQLSERENITLAFIAMLHLLPPRQRAALILRDVLEWKASEVADLFEMTVPAVKSTLHRARATMRDHADSVWISDAMLDEAAQARLVDYVRAWETADIDELLALLKEDATFSMPPIPAWYRGRATIGGLVAKTIFRGDANGRWRLLPTRANGRPAFGLYRNDGEGVYSAYGIQVLTFDGGLIADIITFRNAGLFGYFGLPMTAS